MCICEDLENAKIPEGKAGVVKNRYGYFFSFHLKGKAQDDTAVPINYCPYCGRKLEVNYRNV